MPHVPIDPQHRNRAKLLRQKMTRSETLLWRFIEAHRIDSLTFRRQVTIGPYIVDFACHSARLIVGPDGESDDFDARQERDAIRDAALRKLGYPVMRFTNEDVTPSPEGVVAIIRDAVQSVPPSLAGGGNSAALGATIQDN